MQVVTCIHIVISINSAIRLYKLNIKDNRMIYSHNMIFTNYTIYQNDSLLAICRGTGIGGGGQTPFCILSLDNTATIKFGLYQPSNITREINYNRLIAVKLA